MKTRKFYVVMDPTMECPVAVFSSEKKANDFIDFYHGAWRLVLWTFELNKPDYSYAPLRGCHFKVFGL